MQAQHRAGLVVDHVLVVRGEQERRHRAGGTGGRLDHVRHVALVGLRVEVVELLARVLGVLLEVVVGTLRDALELVEAPRERELDVGRPARIVRQLVVVVGAQAQHLGGDAVLDVPVQPLVAPVLVPVGRLGRRHEELEFHLLELAGAEDPVLRGDLVAEALADLGDPERRLLARRLQHLAEVGEHALRRLGAQVGIGAGALDRAGLGLEHQVELAGLGEAVPSSRSSGTRRGRRACRGGSAACTRCSRPSGSVKFARWPDACQTCGGLKIAASISTTSSRCCTIERTHASLTLRSSSEPSGP